MKENFITPWTNQYSDQMQSRLEKRSKLVETQINPYKTGFQAQNTAEKLHLTFKDHSKEDLEMHKPPASVAGRVILVRDFGKAAFLEIDDSSGRFQIYVSKNDLSPEQFQEYKLSDYGDFVYAEGAIFRTNKGELSLGATRFHVLTKSIRPLPEKFHGLTDPELCHRMRYLDTAMNPESRDVFIKRAKIIKFIRNFFDHRGYLEVETPMLHSVAGGATAKPFLTHHNALDMELFMRIAPELHLKRLLVGGYPRVYELNRCFRNEGLSFKHNPEFTTIEFYEAYATYQQLMDMTEHLMNSLVVELFGTDTITYGEHQISFKKPFARISMRQAVAKFSGLSLEETFVKEPMIKMLMQKGNHKDPGVLQSMSADLLMVECFETFAEENLIQPTFVTEFPTEISPLARRNEQRPEVVDRFELMINGWEVANGFNELNNPTDQMERFAEQAVKKAGGDEEACDVDYDYIRALEYGMPPAAGEGIGVDRLVMLLTNRHSIRDVIFFPQLKREVFFED